MKSKIDTIGSLLKKQDAEIARLRAELAKAHGLANDLLHAGRRDAEEIARLREALERIVRFWADCR